MLNAARMAPYDINTQHTPVLMCDRDLPSWSFRVMRLERVDEGNLQ